jgi:superfamily II DNA/RNA helicase
LVDALQRGGIENAFPIQAATIENALAGKDVLGKARTGSGKTLAFGLPALTRLADSGRAQAHKPRAIVLVPTRELAMQVNDALEPYAHALHVSLRLIAGGLSMSKQISSLERGVHMVVATPGRLADLMRRGHADLSECSLVILDEADHMADMGFMPEITEIMGQVPAGGQRLLFSATLDGEVDRLARDYMNDPVLHDVTGGADEGPSTMTHLVFNTPPHAKYQIATRIAAREGRTIVFVRTKLGCDRIAEQMREAGVGAVALHGDKTQNERNSAITGFRAGTIPVLVATDVAARGIHVDAVDLVMQMDPPSDHKDYTHRAGRTARAGKAGLVVTLVLPHQRRGVDALLGRAGVEPMFRKLTGEDAKSFEVVDQLTGAREPSGIPVPEPRAPRTSRQPGRGGRNDGPRRPSRSGYDGPPRREPARDDRGAARLRDEVARRERELADKERQLELRERQLQERESAVRAPAAATRAPYEKPERSSKAPYSKRPERDGGKPAWKKPERDGGKPAWKKPERDGGKPAWKKPERDGGKPAWKKPERDGESADRKPRTSKYTKGERPAGASELADGKPTYGSSKGPRDDKSRGPRTTGAGGAKAKKAPKVSGRSGKPRPKKKH